jgi:putative acetyltransferase
MGRDGTLRLLYPTNNAFVGVSSEPRRIFPRHPSDVQKRLAADRFGFCRIRSRWTSEPFLEKIRPRIVAAAATYGKRTQGPNEAEIRAVAMLDAEFSPTDSAAEPRKMTQSASICVRPEHSADIAEIRAIAEAAFSASAFGHNGEADLIERLRSGCLEILSLAADYEGRLVGHVLFSPVSLHLAGDCDSPICTGMGLGPLAVLPARQRRGIGSRLVEEGLDLLRQRGCPFACVLGDPAFYGRFGFQPAASLGILCEFGGAEDGAFQIIYMTDEAPGLSSRLAKYRPEFSDLGHEPRP